MESKYAKLHHMLRMYILKTFSFPGGMPTDPLVRECYAMQ